jgi:hypothetical protein
MNPMDKLTALKPTFATVITGLAGAGNLATWLELIKGWAGVAVVIISVPTAVFMMAYWGLKMWKEWRSL